jgi:transcriptional regulator with XRE-family HTH domain
VDLTSIGRNIRKYRKEKGIMQDTLAEMVGLSGNYVGMIERGEKIPALPTLIRIANALGISADPLLCEVLNEKSAIKSSLLSDSIGNLPVKEQQRIFAVIETMIEYADK